MAESSDDGWEKKNAKQEYDEIFGPEKQNVEMNLVSKDEKQDPLRLIKIKITSLLVGEQDLVHNREIVMKFYETYGYEINPSDYGDFTDIDDLLLAMSDKIECFELDGYYLYRAKSDDRMADIQSLVARQMTKDDIYAKRMEKRNGWGANRGPPLPPNTRISRIDVLDTNQKQNKTQMPVMSQKYSSAQTVDSASVRATLRENRKKDKIAQYKGHDWDAPLSDLPSCDPKAAYQTESRHSVHPNSKNKSDRAREGPVSEMNELRSVDGEDLVKAYFDRVGKELPMGQLPAELVQVVFQNPHSFAISSRLPAGSEEDLHIVSFVRPLSRQPKCEVHKIKPATEQNLAWIGLAPFILDVCKFTKASVLYMMSRKSLLVSTFWGNEKGGRFLLINQYIFNLLSTNKILNVSAVVPGQMYVIKSENEFARGILLSQAKTAGKYLFGCVDFNATAEISMGDIYNLPASLYLHKLPGNIFLARLRGVEKLNESHVELFKSRMVQPDVWKKPVATCVIYDFVCVKNKIHVACIDLIVPYKGGHDWLSTILINDEMATEKVDDHPAINKFIAYGTIMAMEKADAFSMRDSDIWSSAKPPSLPEIGPDYPDFDRIMKKIYQPAPVLSTQIKHLDVTQENIESNLEVGEIRDEPISSISVPSQTVPTEIEEAEQSTPPVTVISVPSKTEQMNQLLRMIAQKSLAIMPQQNPDREVLVYKMLDFVRTLQLVLPLSKDEKEDTELLLSDLHNFL